MALLPSSIPPHLRPLPSASVTRRLQSYGPLRHPDRPGLPLAGVRFARATPPTGLPVRDERGWSEDTIGGCCHTAGRFFDWLDERCNIALASVIVPRTIEPNALQCAYAITDTWFPIGGARSLWRPCVNPDSSSEEVKIQLRGSEYGISPIKITIDRRTVSMNIEGERITFDHEGTEQGTTQASRQTSEGLEAHIREVHLGRSARERDATFREMYGRAISEADREADVTNED